MSPGTAAALLPLRASFCCGHTRALGSGRACRRQQGHCGLRPLPREASAAPPRAGSSEGGSANVAAADAWPPPQDWEVYA